MTDAEEMSSAHMAVESSDLLALRELLDSGVDIHEEYDGLTLLHHAIDVEIDSHAQSGQPLHVDLTAYLLARGADPFRRSRNGVSAQQQALVSGHWLALALMEHWMPSQK